MKRPIARIASVGGGAPDRVVTNHDLASFGLETSHEWIVERTGIVERRLAKDDTTTTSMAAEASRQALQRAGLTVADIDTIVLSTATPDRLLPSTAADLQAEIGATNAAAFDISAACSGWLYGVTVGEGLIATGTARNVLVVGSEKMSAIVDWTDRSTCVLFGDGAGACVLVASEEGDDRGILSTYMKSDGTLGDLLYRPAGGAIQPMSEAVLESRDHLVKMAGREVFKHAVRSMADACDQALSRAGLTGDDIDLLIPHQANIRIIESTAKHAGVPMEKVFVNVDRYGNTSSASIPIALDEAIEQGRIKPGSVVLLCAFGAGFTWASMVVRF
ncbi:MAG TPA: beta-ketoacyl-ACP synthase III [Gemmatimonadales bacterium]|nr:beta-ketoacyl-ACP synthase III [Gemmatimonadales bacterium]